MFSDSDIQPYIRNSILSGVEVKVINVISYQFAQYGTQDWQILTTALGHNFTGLDADKVRMSQLDIYKIDQNCESLCQKLHTAINIFVFKTRIYGMEIDLIEHLLEALCNNLPFRTPTQILKESILHEKLKH